MKCVNNDLYPPTLVEYRNKEVWGGGWGRGMGSLKRSTVVSPELSEKGKK